VPPARPAIRPATEAVDAPSGTAEAILRRADLRQKPRTGLATMRPIDQRREPLQRRHITTQILRSHRRGPHRRPPFHRRRQQISLDRQRRTFHPTLSRQGHRRNRLVPPTTLPRRLRRRPRHQPRPPRAEPVQTASDPTGDLSDSILKEQAPRCVAVWPLARPWRREREDDCRTRRESGGRSGRLGRRRCWTVGLADVPVAAPRLAPEACPVPVDCPLRGNGVKEVLSVGW
jgi:hypothetical protein